jgi:hypothetical protein
MAAGQINLIQFLTKSEEKFLSLSLSPLTIGIFTIFGFENNNRREIFIFQKESFLLQITFLLIPNLMKRSDN